MARKLLADFGDDFFSFDSDDDSFILSPPPPVVANNKNKRKKIIGLDDLFNEHKKEQETIKKKQSRVVKAWKTYASDDDDDVGNETENKLTEALQMFKKNMQEVDGREVALDEPDGEEAMSSWGLQVFGTQRAPPSPVAAPDLQNCKLLQSVRNNEVLVNHGLQTGETFLRGLLVNGWLANLVIKLGNLEESIAKWTLNLLLYSPEDSLMTSACDFWSAILLSDEADSTLVKIEWLPGFSELKQALESYGFQLLPLVGAESVQGHHQSNNTGVSRRGPPLNIRAWIRFVDVCSQVRRSYNVFSTSEAEELVGLLIYLFLERQLVGMSVAMHDCSVSLINYFEEEEWSSSCEKVAKSLANRVPRNLNCLRMIECISRVDSRSKQLRSTIASQLLRICYSEEVTEISDILKSLVSRNLKVRDCNLSDLYIHLVLTENWLIYGEKSNAMVYELWSKFIWKCTTQITNTDFRPCAQELRSRASYLLPNSN